jgi:Tfp pilus assembly protein PilV
VSTRPKRSPGGFALVEALVAVVLLTVGALAFAATGVANLRLELSAARRNGAATLATTRLEQLRSHCAPAAGTDSLPGIATAWRASASDGVVELLDSVSVVESPGRAPHTESVWSASPC